MNKNKLYIDMVSPAAKMAATAALLLWRVATMAAAPAPFFYLLVEDNHTEHCASTPPPWGRPLPTLPAAGAFQMTHWKDIVPVLVHRLARHSGRARSLTDATCCVAASPPFGSRAARSDCGRADWERRCAGKPIVVIDGPDADGARDSLCGPLWRNCRRDGARDAIVRVTGSHPGLMSDVGGDGTRSLCRRLDTPYLGHARLPLAAVPQPTARPTRIAYAGAVWGHVDSEAMGFNAWRRAIRNECKKLHVADASSCRWAWVSMRGS